MNMNNIFVWEVKLIQNLKSYSPWKCCSEKPLPIEVDQESF